MTIPDPQFDLHELVTLHWNERDYNTKIILRYFNPDKDGWAFKVHCLNQMITATVLSPRN